MCYICPICNNKLNLDNRTYKCENNHCFDLAKEGYVNLMPVQFKHSKEPGDSKEMMQARREFLNHEHFAPMRDAVCNLILNIKTHDTFKLLDIGCGEGYYTSEIKNRNQSANIFGLDIAKVAIKYAAKRAKSVNFCVASSNKLPFADNSLDFVVKIYAPCNEDELIRVLKPSGKLITVTPAPYHLFELKEMVYPKVTLHAEHACQIKGFKLESQEFVKYKMQLNSIDATALLQMTPFAWRAKNCVWDDLTNQDMHLITADFAISCYQKA